MEPRPQASRLTRMTKRPQILLWNPSPAPYVEAIKAAGGSVDGEPRPYGNTGIVIGIAVDPAGNRIELIQRP